MEEKLASVEIAFEQENTQNQSLANEMQRIKEEYETQLQEFKRKLQWYTENQQMLDAEPQEMMEKDLKIDDLEEQIRKMESLDGGRKKVNQLQKQVKDLEEALKKRHPNSLPALITAAKPSTEETEAVSRLQAENMKLEREIVDREKTFEKKLRNLRQEQDKINLKYEKVKGTRKVPESVKDKRIMELESQVQDTKDYYIRRISGLETQNKDKKTKINKKHRERDAKNEFISEERAIEDRQLMGKIKDLEKHIKSTDGDNARLKSENMLLLQNNQEARQQANELI